MFISEKKNVILKSKKVAKHGALLSFSVFVLSLLAGFFVTSGSVVNILGDVSVFSTLFFILSSVCFFLIQIEVWEKDQA